MAQAKAPGVVRAQWSDGFHDILAKNLVVVFCGLNPSAGAAKVGHNFESKSNRFWRAIHEAGFTPHQIAPAMDRSLLLFGCGITAAVSRPTRRAGEVSRSEFSRAADHFERKIAHYRPRVVAFLGKVAYLAMTDQNHAGWGVQRAAFGGATAWLLPNPSGLNRAFRLNDLVEHYRQLQLAVADHLKQFAAA